MFNHFIFSINTVVPIFFLVTLGYVLKKREFLPEKFISAGNRLVFYILLPIAMFNSVYVTDLDELFNVGFAAFAIGASVVSWAVIWVISAFFIKDKRVLGSFVQGAFRSNTVFFGIPLMRNLAGEAGVARFALIIALIMPVYNICSILVLSVCADTGEKLKLKTIALTIAKNPLIIAIVTGSVFSLLNVPLPQSVTRTLNDLSDMAPSMSLICLGGGITFLGFEKKFKYAFVASVLKVIILPIAFTAAAFAFGFRGIDLAAFMVLGGLPSAFAGYVMAVQIGCDAYTSSNIIIISTLLSALTLMLFIYLWRWGLFYDIV
ncbi:MAG: AEC family transporter [Defluviitaleaceae bacterium]|nr:AEC family transporter [Defluviitaleaceae bacterium]